MVAYSPCCGFFWQSFCFKRHLVLYQAVLGCHWCVAFLRPTAIVGNDFYPQKSHDLVLGSQHVFDDSVAGIF
ncbi:MAG: hypothetical protein EAY75_17180 [Bacteroidetes bacterium]|nr:MAG: hypothetical protein EAY75_17180 [Bacteroidota bacterium]